MKLPSTLEFVIIVLVTNLKSGKEAKEHMKRKAVTKIQYH